MNSAGNLEHSFQGKCCFMMESCCYPLTLLLFSPPCFYKLNQAQVIELTTVTSLQHGPISTDGFKKRKSISPACQARPRLLLRAKWVFCFSAGRERPLTQNVTCPVLKLLYQFQHECNQQKCIH